MDAYIISIATALLLILISAIIANTIQFEGGANPKDPQKRKLWFWIFAILTPLITFLLGYYVFKPDDNIMIVNRFLKALGIGTGVAFITYIFLGYVLSKIFKNGKIGNWF